MNRPTNTEAGAVADVAAKLTEAQRAALLAIRPGEQRRAIDFSGSVARNLCRSNASRPALLWGTLTASGQVAWFEHSPSGAAVRQHLEQGATAGVAEMNEQMFGQGDSPRQDEGTVV